MELTQRNNALLHGGRRPDGKKVTRQATARRELENEAYPFEVDNNFYVPMTYHDRQVQADTRSAEMQTMMYIRTM